MCVLAADFNAAIVWRRGCTEAEAKRYIIRFRSEGYIQDSEQGYVLIDRELQDLWVEYRDRGTGRSGGEGGGGGGGGGE